MMLEFGSENKEITEKCPNAPFILSISDNSDNELIIVIALPKRGENADDLDAGINNDNPGFMRSDLKAISYINAEMKVTHIGKKMKSEKEII